MVEVRRVLGKTCGCGVDSPDSPEAPVALVGSPIRPLRLGLPRVTGPAGRQRGMATEERPKGWAGMADERGKGWAGMATGERGEGWVGAPAEEGCGGYSPVRYCS